MNLWFREPALDTGEAATWTTSAHWLQDPWHDIAGRLYLTRTRLLFEPTRLYSRGWGWWTMLHLIVSVSSQPADIPLFPVAYPPSLRVDLASTQREHFVVRHLQDVVEVIGAAIPRGHVDGDLRPS